MNKPERVKVCDFAKEKFFSSKEMLDLLKSMEVPVKTPISVVPNDMLPMLREKIAPKAAPEPVVLEGVAKPEKLPRREFKTVKFEGMDARFSQVLLGIRRRFLHDKKTFSLLTYAFDPDTLEVLLIKEEPKRTEADAILDFRMAVRKYKVE